MPRATFRFYAELNDFLTIAEAGREFEYEFLGAPAIKDSIEAIGVPHPEVDLILVNGKPADFEAQLKNRDRVSVYPSFRRLELASKLSLQPALARPVRFVADIHLGQLSRYLRMIGFDCSYDNQADDQRLAARSAAEDRILLSRDQELLKRSIVRHGYYVRSVQPKQQLLEVSRRYQLAAEVQPFKFCMECNGLLRQVSKDEVIKQLPGSVRQEHQTFMQCQRCHRVYWQGSHVERMQDLIGWLMVQLETGDSS